MRAVPITRQRLNIRCPICENLHLVPVSEYLRRRAKNVEHELCCSRWCAGQLTRDVNRLTHPSAKKLIA